jgi:hypothetical protein
MFDFTHWINIRPDFGCKALLYIAIRNSSNKQNDDLASLDVSSFTLLTFVYEFTGVSVIQASLLAALTWCR